jgi:DNA-binding LytR/AlgR family response regulator
VTSRPGLSLLVVDDERPATEDLVRMLRASAGVGTIDTAQSAEQALVLLSDRPFDALFLDVRMPGLDGIELARILQRFDRPPAVVFVSAHDAPAVDAFELRALDYLLKPVDRRRLEEALGRVRTARAPDAPAREDRDVVPVDLPRGGGTRLLPRGSILYLQAQGDYVRIVADDGRFLLRGRLSDIERRWEPFGFVRVHRGYVVNLRRAVQVRPQLNGTAVLVFANRDEVPIARRQIAELRRMLSV